MANHHLIPLWTFAACCALAGALLPARAEAQAELIGGFTAGGGTVEAGAAQGSGVMLRAGLLNTVPTGAPVSLRLTAIPRDAQGRTTITVRLNTSIPAAGAQLSLHFNPQDIVFDTSRSAGKGSLIEGDNDWGVQAHLIDADTLRVVVTSITAVTGGRPPKAIGPTTGDSEFVLLPFQVTPQAPAQTPLNFEFPTKLVSETGDEILIAWADTKAQIRPPDTESPRLTNPQADPTSLPKEGGKVTLRVTASDDMGVTSAQAEVTKSDSGKDTVQLSLKEGTPTVGTWQGEYTAPANSTGSPQTYTVVFFAKDAAGNQGGPTSPPAEFTVAACTTQDAIDRASVSPTNLPSSGGTVTVSVTLSGCQGEKRLKAEAKKGKGKKAKTVASTEIFSDQGNNTYTGSLSLPANNAKKAVTYYIYVSLNGGKSVAAGSVTVAGKGGKRQGVLEDDEDAPKIGAHTPLSLRLLSTVGGNNGAATVFAFTLNRPAQVTARVVSPTGKAVRQFTPQQAKVGLNSLLWDGKAQAGGSAARGVYLIEIAAQDEKGQAARAAKVMAVR